MIAICAIIRMLDGICFRIQLIKKLENAVTVVRAMHMVTVVLRLLVTANAEQIPSICKAIGLLSMTGPNNTFLISEAIILHPFLFHFCQVWTKAIFSQPELN